MNLARIQLVAGKLFCYVNILFKICPYAESFVTAVDLIVFMKCCEILSVSLGLGINIS